MTTVSLILCSRDRPEPLERCLERLAAADLTDVVEVVVVDQSAPGAYDALVARFADRLPLRHAPTATRGLAAARNVGVRAARGDLCLFTDDDCLPAPDWVPALRRALAGEGVSGATGRILPHGLREGQVPLAVREGTRPLTARGFTYPFTLGSGNNMGFRRAVLYEVGGFLEDLGAGTAAHSCEEVEIFLRVLEAGGAIAYAPDAVVYHDAWRTPEEVVQVKRGYFFGAAYFLVRGIRQGDRFALRTLVRRVIRELAAPLVLEAPRAGRERRCLMWAQVAGTWRGLLAGLSAPKVRRRPLHGDGDAEGRGPLAGPASGGYF